MGALDDFRGDSYCGLYCGACEVLNLYRDGLARGETANWEDLPWALKEVIPPSPLVCTGCKTETLSPGCRACAVRVCAGGKRVEACVLCAEYPCALVEAQRRRAREGLEEILPHIRVKFSQEERIRRIGYASWREEQSGRWRCPKCGAAFTWYQETCAGCGVELERFKEHFHPS